MKPTRLITIASLFLFVCTIQAQTNSASRFITTFGGISSSDSPWEVQVSAADKTFHISYRYAPDTNSSASVSVDSSSDWKARTGWFVFIENNERVWAYDGGSSLFLQSAKTAKLGPTCTSYGPRSFPCPVPDVVLSRLSPEARKAIKSDKK